MQNKSDLVVNRQNACFRTKTSGMIKHTGNLLSKYSASVKSLEDWKMEKNRQWTNISICAVKALRKTKQPVWAGNAHQPNKQSGTDKIEKATLPFYLKDCQTPERCDTCALNRELLILPEKPRSTEVICRKGRNSTEILCTFEAILIKMKLKVYQKNDRTTGIQRLNWWKERVRAKCSWTSVQTHKLKPTVNMEGHKMYWLTSWKRFSALITVQRASKTSSWSQGLIPGTL